MKANGMHERALSHLLEIGAVAVIALAASSARASPPATTNELVSRAMNATPDTARGRVAYESHCSSCHGRQAWGVGVEAIPALAGQREFYLVTQLAKFHTQDRIGSTMHRAVSASDIADPKTLRNLAAYLSAAPIVTSPDQGDGLDLRTGEQLYETNCAMCHGQRAEGSESEPIPKLAGQHYTYILSQLKSFAAGHRNQVEPPVLDFTAGLSTAQERAIADYVSRAESRPPRP
jgi:cytochrome c553